MAGTETAGIDHGVIKTLYRRIMEWADETDERKNGLLHLDAAGGVFESLKLSVGSYFQQKWRSFLRTAGPDYSWPQPACSLVCPSLYNMGH